MATTALETRSPFNDLLEPVGSGRGVIVFDRSGVALAGLQARRGQVEALEFRLQSNRKALRLSPETWWVLGASPGELNPLRDIASVVEQTDAYGVLRLTGPRVRDVLAKLFFIDLHPDAFKPGDVASTVAAHMGVTLWRPEDAPDGAVFELAVHRSMASSFWHALHASAAEYGIASS